MTTLPILNSPALSRGWRHDRPVSTEIAPANVRGARANRLMVIFRAPGCAYDLRGGGCTYCGFRHLTTLGEAVTAGEYAAQLEYALRGRDLARDEVFQIDLFNSGNFLNDDEVPEEARLTILARCVAQPSVRVVVVESRPEYILVPKLAAMQKAARRRQGFTLEVAIGLDAFEEKHLRAVRKGISRAAFESAAANLGATGTDLMAYVVLKPCRMSDEEALGDARNAAEYIHAVAARHGIRSRVSLEPAFVVPGTELAAEYRAGRYRPPSLELVLEAARRIAPLGPLTVGLWDEGLHPLARPAARPGRAERIVSALRLFNFTQSPEVLSWDGPGAASAL
jgi:hypothetical protein